MTLRQLLQSVDVNIVCLFINKKDQETIPVNTNGPSLQQTIDAYSSVVSELLDKPKVKKYKHSILVQESKDPFDGKMYPDVCFYNNKYVPPPKGAKPWGGKDHPKGYYNINDNKYNETFAMGWTPWSKIIDTDVIVKAPFSNEKAVAEILWELTFYGWTEKNVKATVSGISKKIDIAKKEIKKGKYIKLPPKKEGEFTVVIPESVMKDLNDISKKQKSKENKCKTCYGFGLWGFGLPSPIGPMDASDGIPTIPCPECKANHNPQRK